MITMYSVANINSALWGTRSVGDVNTTAQAVEPRSPEIPSSGSMRWGRSWRALGPPMSAAEKAKAGEAGVRKKRSCSDASSVVARNNETSSGESQDHSCATRNEMSSSMESQVEGGGNDRASSPAAETIPRERGGCYCRCNPSLRARSCG